MNLPLTTPDLGHRQFSDEMLCHRETENLPSLSKARLSHIFPVKILYIFNNLMVTAEVPA